MNGEQHALRGGLAATQRLGCGLQSWPGKAALTAPGGPRHVTHWEPALATCHWEQMSGRNPRKAQPVQSKENKHRRHSHHLTWRPLELDTDAPWPWGKVGLLPQKPPLRLQLSSKEAKRDHFQQDLFAAWSAGFHQWRKFYSWGKESMPPTDLWDLSETKRYLAAT